MSGERILVLQGPNLDLLGIREPERYGTETLADVEARLDALAGRLDVTLAHFQSAQEGALVERVHAAWRDGCSGALVNAAGYTHTSVSLRDALLATKLPFVEVHLSNPFARESFRRESLLADLARGVVVGFGALGYEIALRGLVGSLRAPPGRGGSGTGTPADPP